jgi:hypothetical protein
MRYRIFTRTWWRVNKNWPEGREPSPGRKRTVRYVNTIEEARQFCSEYNRAREPGGSQYNKRSHFLGHKAEFESV